MHSWGAVGANFEVMTHCLRPVVRLPEDGVNIEKNASGIWEISNVD